MFDHQTRIFFGYPLTVHESPVTDQHESSVRPKWNEFPICTSAMCRFKSRACLNFYFKSCCMLTVMILKLCHELYVLKRSFLMNESVSHRRVSIEYFKGFSPLPMMNKESLFKLFLLLKKLIILGRFYINILGYV